jgi:hypothetical protein
MPILGVIASSTRQGLSTSSYESIATVTGNTSNSFTFSSIPQTFTHLQFRTMSRVSLASYTFSAYSMRFGNGSVDTGSNYSNHRFYTSGNNTVTADGSFNDSSAYAPFWTANNAIANNVAVSIVDILDYSNTNKYKTFKLITGFDNNNSGDAGFTANSAAAIQFTSGNWRSNSAIDTISFTIGGSATNSIQSIALYGIKGA